VNVLDWSRRLGHDQGQLRDGARAIVAIGGQRPVDAQGRLLHEGDTVAQVALALDNLTDVVLAARMTLADVVHLRIHTTSRAALLDALFVVNEHLAAEGATTPLTVIEVSGLALAGMEVEIDGLAVRTDRSTEGTPT
jgi:enamine deaminase RidA (YjgF/YER057c/UK114 family)